ncbi:MAG: family metallopeptidase [Gammaproteobacteria bacterium]|jgi:predicted metal-dependent hydrolase|nr:family metallopeptidase [Gammaproteobacteria bacterium]
MLRVNPDLSLSIRAPLFSNVKWIESFIAKKASWIVAQQEILKQKLKIAEQGFGHGSKLYYLGKALQIHIEPDEILSVQIKDDKIYLACSAPNSSEIILKNWYKEEANKLFIERFNYCYQSIQHLKLPAPKKLRIKPLKSRWGSCASNQNISLNLDLIQYPIECIDYVIFHELCHLKEMNHGPGFYALMDQAMANWQTHRQTLRRLHKSTPSLL